MKHLNHWVLPFGLLAGLPPNIGGEESKKIFPLTDFYDTPEPFDATGHPGHIIRSMKFDGYNLPEGVEATRILYGTKTSQGDLVTCSGVVLVPPVRHQRVVGPSLPGPTAHQE